ncbi:YlxR family protein [Thermodesulfobacteriota bacterium]
MKAVGPVRTCLGCGERKAKVLLWRFVLDSDKRVKWDQFYSSPGRGVYCCKNDICLQSMVRREKRVAASFRSQVKGFHDHLPVIDTEKP